MDNILAADEELVLDETHKSLVVTCDDVGTILVYIFGEEDAGNRDRCEAINFGGAVAANKAFRLYQNTPNPFKGETMIGFDLPETAQGTLTVFDLEGKALQVVRRTFDQGYNQVNFKSNDLPAGVLYYTLTTDNFTATRPMVIID